MKRFLINFAVFILVVGSFAFGLSALSDFLVNQRKSQLLRISEDITKVFMGDSNIECAVNDSLIPHSINIGQSGEAYMYSYIKLKSLLEQNKQIRSVFIGFSNVDILKDTETRWLFDDGFVIEKIAAYNYLLSYSEKSLIMKNNPKAYFRGLMKSVISNFKAIVKSYSSENTKTKIQNFGSYGYVVRDKLQEGIKLDLLIKAQPVEKSLIQEKYLMMISKLCQQKSIKLILLNTPKYRSYSYNREEVRKIWLSVRNSLSADSLLDFSALNLADSCFSDLTHLNYKGAKLFSQYLNEKIQSGQNGTSDSIKSIPIQSSAEQH